MTEFWKNENEKAYEGSDLGPYREIEESMLCHFLPDRAFHDGRKARIPLTINTVHRLF
jgi:hypothetical protein